MCDSCIVSRQKPIIVVVATQKADASGRAAVGYFKTMADVPADFTYPTLEDITGVYKSMGRHIENADERLDYVLRLMNNHWQTAIS